MKPTQFLGVRNKVRGLTEVEDFQDVVTSESVIPVTALQTMDQDTRNKLLSRLRNDGLSLRQICRIPGLQFHIVRKA